MECFFDWFPRQGFDPGATWLMLGKGPSFEKRSQYDLAKYRTVSLNHVVRELPVFISHVVDLDVLDTAGDAVLANAGWLLMPWVPHVNQWSGEKTLAEIAKTHRVIGEMEKRGRLLWYNLGTTKNHNGSSPVVKVKGFSSEAVLSLLAQAGAKKVRSLGVDGGTTYGGTFQDLQGKTLLANGLASFDVQFQGIASTIRTTGVEFGPLDVQTPVKVFVGATEAQTLAVRLLEYSIKKHASISVEVFPLWKSTIPLPVPKDPKNKPRTPFSFQRFQIPELCGFTGRGIYVDSDMQVFRDIRELWTMPMGEADVFAASEVVGSARRPQFSVLLIDCEKCKWSVADIVRRLDEGEWSYDKLMKEFAVARCMKPEISPSWNSLERFDPTETRLLHYTDMDRQPWVSAVNPLGYLWFRDLFQAIDEGVITLDEVKADVAKGWLRPSVLWQIERRLDDNLLLPGGARRLDAKYQPPFEGGIKRLGAFSHPGAKLRAYWRRFYEASPLPKWRRRWKRRLTKKAPKGPKRA